MRRIVLSYRIILASESGRRERRFANQKVGGSNPFGRTQLRGAFATLWRRPCGFVDDSFDDVTDGPEHRRASCPTVRWLWPDSCLPMLIAAREPHALAFTRSNRTYGPQRSRAQTAGLTRRSSYSRRTGAAGRGPPSAAFFAPPCGHRAIPVEAFAEGTRRSRRREGAAI